MDEQLKQVLELVAQPAFLAKEDEILWCNGAAQGLQGLAVSSLMEDRGALYSLWDRRGKLQLPLTLWSDEYDVTVCAMGDEDLFVAAPRSGQKFAVADAMVSTSASLRKSLHHMMGAARELFDSIDEQPNANAAQMNRALYQMIRLCGQLADGGQLLRHSRSAHRRPTDMNAFFAAFVAELKPLLETAGGIFCYTPLKEPVRADVDTVLLERALYNLISNALQYNPRGCHIDLTVERRGAFLLVQVSDSGSGIKPSVLSNLFEQYNSPSLEASKGVGLGLSITREVVRLHGGSMTVNTEGGGTTVAFTLSLQPAPLELRSSMLQYDYCGELHHGLVELADVLDAEVYDPRDVL